MWQHWVVSGVWDLVFGSFSMCWTVTSDMVVDIQHTPWRLIVHAANYACMSRFSVELFVVQSFCVVQAVCGVVAPARHRSSLSAGAVAAVLDWQECACTFYDVRAHVLVLCTHT
jgi:hypothetical protein